MAPDAASGHDPSDARVPQIQYLGRPPRAAGFNRRHASLNSKPLRSSPLAGPAVSSTTKSDDDDDEEKKEEEKEPTTTYRPSRIVSNPELSDLYAAAKKKHLPPYFPLSAKRDPCAAGDDHHHHHPHVRCATARPDLTLSSVPSCMLHMTRTAPPSSSPQHPPPPPPNGVLNADPRPLSTGSSSSSSTTTTSSTSTHSMSSSDNSTPGDVKRDPPSRAHHPHPHLRPKHAHWLARDPSYPPRPTGPRHIHWLTHHHHHHHLPHDPPPFTRTSLTKHHVVMPLSKREYEANRPHHHHHHHHRRPYHYHHRRAGSAPSSNRSTRRPSWWLSDLMIDPPHESWAGRVVLRSVQEHEATTTSGARPAADKPRFSLPGAALVSLLGLSRRRHSQAEEEEEASGSPLAPTPSLAEEGEEEGGGASQHDTATLCSWTMVDERCDVDAAHDAQRLGRTGSIKKLWRRLSGASRRE